MSASRRLSEGVFGEQLEEHPPLLLDERDHNLATPDEPLTPDEPPTQDEPLAQDEGEHLDEESTNGRSCGWWLLVAVLGGVAVVFVSTVIVLVRDVVMAPVTRARNPEFLAPATPASGVGAVPVAAPLSSGALVGGDRGSSGSVAPDVVAPVVAGASRPRPPSTSTEAPDADGRAPEGAVQGPMHATVKGETEFNYAGKRYVEKVLTDDMVKLIKDHPRWRESLRTIAQRPTKWPEEYPKNKMGPLLLTNGVAAVLKDQKSCETRELLLAYSMAVGLVAKIRGDH